MTLHVVTEGVESMWHYHLSLPESKGNYIDDLR